MTNQFFTDEDFDCDDNCALHLSPACQEAYPECFVSRFNFKVAPLIEERDKLKEILKECIVELKKYELNGMDCFGGYTKLKIEKAKEFIK